MVNCTKKINNFIGIQQTVQWYIDKLKKKGLDSKHVQHMVYQSGPDRKCLWDNQKAVFYKYRIYPYTEDNKAKQNKMLKGDLKV